MLPTLSRFSVGSRPESCLRHRGTSQYLRIPPLLCEFHSPLLHPSQAVSPAVPQLSRGLSQMTYSTPRRPLRPVIPDNACILRLTAAAGTKFADAYSWSTVIGRAFPPDLILSPEKEFTTRRHSSPTRCRWIRLSSIVQDSSLLPPVGVWAVSQSQCGWPSSQTSYPSSPW